MLVAWFTQTFVDICASSVLESPSREAVALEGTNCVLALVNSTWTSGTFVDIQAPGSGPVETCSAAALEGADGVFTCGEGTARVPGTLVDVAASSVSSDESILASAGV